MRNPKRWSLIAILMSSLAMAQAPNQQISGQRILDGEEVETCTIEGFVVRMGTGEPLRKAQVMLRPERGRNPVFGAMTDTSGRFHLENIQPGNYRLHVERDGYVDQQYGQVSPSRPGTVLVLAPGQTVDGVVVSLVPTGTIAGRIYDEDGEPIEGATVRALRYGYQDGEKVLSRVSQAETNDLGEYRLYWLTPGEYFVSATFEDRFRALNALRQATAAAAPLSGGVGLGRGGRGFALPLPDPLEQVYVDTYYPGITDPLSASAMKIDPGTEIPSVDFTLLPTRAVTVSGTVVGPFAPEDGISPNVVIVPRSDVTRARVNFRGGRGRGGGRGGGRGDQSRDSSFELTGVAPGSYTVAALVRIGQDGGRGGGRGGRGGGNSPQLTGLIDIEVGEEDVEDLIVPVEPGTELTGQVLVDQTATEINVGRIRVSLEAVTDLPVGAPNARVDDDGSFTLNNLPRALHRLTVTGLAQNAYVAAAKVGGQDVLASGLQVVPGMPRLELSISGSGARIDGSVSLDADVVFTGAQVVLIPDDPFRTDLYKVASADQYGRFSFQGISPGEYTVYAWEDAPSGAYRDPGFVIEYEDWGERISVDQGSQLQAQPRLIPAGS